MTNEKYMTVNSEGSKSKAKYFFSDESVVVAPQKEVVMPDAEVSFELKNDVLSKLMKMAAIMKLPDLSLVGKSGDEGKPIVESNPDNEISKIYLDIAKKIKSSFIEN